MRRIDREPYAQGTQCERCGHLAHHVGPDGYCGVCAGKLKASEEWEPEDAPDQHG